MKNLKITIDRTGTNNITVIINYIRTLLCVEALREFDKLESQITGTTNARLDFIKEGLLGFFPDQFISQAEVCDAPRNV